MLSERRFNTYWNVLKVIFAIILARFVLSRTELDQLLALRDRIIFSFVLFTFILYALLTLFKAFKYHLLIQQDTEFPRVLNIVVMQNALSNFFTNSAGIASYLALLRIEEKVRLVRSGLVFLITKIGDLFAVWIVMIVCSTLLWDRIALLQSVLLPVIFLVGIGFAIFFCSIAWRSKFISGLSASLTKLNVTKIPFASQFILMLDEFAKMDQGVVVRTVLIAFGLSFVHYIVTIVWMVVSLRAFSLHVESLVIVFVSGILQLYSFVPVTVFGGLGVTEVTSLYLYSQFGLEHSEVSAVLVGWRILYYLTNLAVLIYLPVYALFIERNMKRK